MWKHVVVGALAGNLCRVWRHTLRCTLVGAENLENAPRGIYALYHGRGLGLILFFARRGVISMASRSADGELAARMIGALGVKAVRGSTGKGGRLALDQLEEEMADERNQFAALTVDGPRGPRARPKPGAAELARRLALPIVPLSFSARPCLRLKSWDRMIVPAPFGRCRVTIGELIDVSKWPTNKEACDEIKRVLDRAALEDDIALHGQPLWPEE
ncbi:MAG: DUF374 domain-containing protein [bacterium]|nr:DUF374 domain-containing protein [bacterium]